ncbi:DUF1217 domain-containing protein [Oricola indica]|jgi:hypothetical protein|uniref:DUF1217 domain-containing protein n=1 Tax=Oricola indica TaxID=2872591 RepID=UPI001CBD3385|nr:DUF1217 domain-containing protein [Oricola indica]
MISTLVSYKLASEDIATTIKRVSEQPVVSRDVEYYLENIGNVDTIEDLTSDYRLFSFAMKAHGLSDMTYAKAFMEKVLEEGIDDDRAFANTLSDKRYAEFAKTFNFKSFGEATTSFTKTQQGVVDKYLRQTLEEQAGDENQGVRLALYFERKADTIENFYQILADPALSQVVRTTLGLPESFATVDIDKQVELISDRIDLETLADPDKLDKLLERFTALWDVDHSTESQAVSQIAQLFNTGPQLGISQDLMLQIAQMKR